MKPHRARAVLSEATMPVRTLLAAVTSLTVLSALERALVALDGGAGHSAPCPRRQP